MIAVGKAFRGSNVTFWSSAGFFMAETFHNRPWKISLRNYHSVIGVEKPADGKNKAVFDSGKPTDADNVTFSAGDFQRQTEPSRVRRRKASRQQKCYARRTELVPALISIPGDAKFRSEATLGGKNHDFGNDVL
ncbi:MAG: hypothetical protein JWM68_4321 [Verrucomicrobiales bacterium]|nr:hypothetical protein [Verrucomicrobiales bacterium]